MDVGWQPMLSQIGGNSMASTSGITISDPIWKAMERWLYKFKQNSIKASSFNRLLTSYNTMRNYSIAFMRIMDLTSDDIQNYVNLLLSDGYSKSAIKKQYNLITAFFKFLLGEGLQVRPVYLNVILPSETKISKPKRDVEAYDDPDQKKLKLVSDEVDNDAAHAVIILLETGMRIGELLALMWSDVLWARRAVRIHRTLVNPANRGKSYVQDDAKSKTSNRTIPLSPKAMSVLRKMYENSPCMDGLVFCVEGNKDVSIAYNPLAKAVKAICKAANVQWKGFHVFRHTFATNCYYKGCDIKKLSKLLGHANVTITYNIYINLYGDMLEELREIVD